jgi:glycosyltransferase involved in cell wall biosynthesis
MAPGRAGGAKIRNELGIKADEKLIGNIGALVDAKGQHCLVEAIPMVLKEVPDAKFVIVGGGKLEAKLKALAAQRGVSDSVFFPGHREDIGGFLDAFDAFVLPSRMEGLNNSVIEAMMVGKPVIGTDVGGIPEIIEHEKTGLLIPPGDHAALAEAIVNIVNDSEKAAALASEGRDFALRRFTAERMVSDPIGVYDKLLRDR